jgi:hypothetical protein
MTPALIEQLRAATDEMVERQPAAQRPRRAHRARAHGAMGAPGSPALPGAAGLVGRLHLALRAAAGEELGEQLQTVSRQTRAIRGARS